MLILQLQMNHEDFNSALSVSEAISLFWDGGDMTLRHAKMLYEKYVSPYCRYYGTINKCYNPHYSHTRVLCGGAAQVKSVDFLHLVWKSVCSIPMEDMIGELRFMSRQMYIMIARCQTRFIWLILQLSCRVVNHGMRTKPEDALRHWEKISQRLSFIPIKFNCARKYALATIPLYERWARSTSCCISLGFDFEHPTLTLGLEPLKVT
jgi:hypothetical protein